MATYITAESDLYPYISQAQLDELLDDDDDADADTSIFNGLVAAVEAKFHSYVARRYVVPITDANGIIVATDYCCRLFEYYAFARRQSVTNEIGSRYRITTEELEKIRDGKLALWDPPPDEATTQGGDFNATTDDRDYTPDSMASYGGGDSRTTD